MNDSADSDMGVLSPDVVYEETRPTFELHGSPEQVDKLLTELALAQGEFEAVAKNVEGRDGNRTFMYADTAAIVRASRPSLSKHRIAITQYPLGDEGELLTIVSGHGARIHSTLRFRRADTTVAGVPGIKLYGSELTYFSRYVLRSVLGLPGDDDLDSQPQAQPSSRGERMQPDKPKPTPAKATQQAAQQNPATSQEAIARRQAGELTPKHVDTQEEAMAKAKARTAEPPPTEPPPAIETTGEVVDDINGPDGEAVPDDIDPNLPMTPQTKLTLRTTMTKLFSVDGSGDDVTAAMRGSIFRVANGRPLERGVLPTEVQSRRMIDWMYSLGAEHQIDPDSKVSKDDVHNLLKALGKRAGVQ